MYCRGSCSRPDPLQSCYPGQRSLYWQMAQRGGGIPEEERASIGRAPGVAVFKRAEGEGDPVELVKGWRIPGDSSHCRSVSGHAISLSSMGVLDNERMNMVEKWMINNFKSPVGDFRDWEPITAWATSIVEDK